MRSKAQQKQANYVIGHYLAYGYELSVKMEGDAVEIRVNNMITRVDRCGEISQEIDFKKVVQPGWLVLPGVDVTKGDETPLCG